MLRVKGQVLHREHTHLKVPGCSLVLSALLTKKLPTFLSRLNEIRRLRKDSTSLGIILEQVIKNDTFDCVIMRMESEGEWDSVILIYLILSK